MDMLRHRARGFLAVASLLVPLAACPHHHHKPNVPPDWTPPLFVVAVEYDGISPGFCPSAEEFSAEYNRVARAWLDWWRAKPVGGRPAGMPGPGEVVHATVTCRRSCTTSADELGDGYNVTVKAWSCTLNQPESKAFMLSAACHGLSHHISGLSGGNAAHRFFAAVCGC